MKSIKDRLQRTSEIKMGEFAVRKDAFRTADCVPPVPEEEKPEAAVQRVVVPQPIRQNSVYRQLMRSHDRVNTRHLKG